MDTFYSKEAIWKIKDDIVQEREAFGKEKVMKKKISGVITVLLLLVMTSTVVFAAEGDPGSVGVDLSQYEDGDVIPAEVFPENHFPETEEINTRSVATSTYTYSLKGAESTNQYWCSNLRKKDTNTPMYLKVTSSPYRVGFRGYGRRANGLSSTSGSAYLYQGQEQYVTNYLFEWNFSDLVGLEAKAMTAKNYKATILWSPDVVR